MDERVVSTREQVSDAFHHRREQEAGAVVEDSILLREARIEAGARVHRAVVDEETVIGADGSRGSNLPPSR